MVAPIRPASAKTYTREKWIFVPTIASQAAPTVVEVTAAGALDVSLMLYEDTGKPTPNTNRVTKPKRLGDVGPYEQIGDFTVTGGTATFSLDPQAAALSNGKKAWEKFVAGTVGFWVRRLALAIATDPLAGQFVDVYPVEYGTPVPTTHGDAEAGEAAFDIEYAITGPPSFLVALV